MTAMLETVSTPDLCDGCGGQTRAQVRATLANGGKLVFCNHCARIHVPVLLEKFGATVAPINGTENTK